MEFLDVIVVVEPESETPGFIATISFKNRDGGLREFSAIALCTAARMDSIDCTLPASIDECQLITQGALAHDGIELVKSLPVAQMYGTPSFAPA